MSTIFENVKAKQAEFLEHPDRAGQNMAMALAAMKDGIKSDAWLHYMSQFVSRHEDGSLDEDQLGRLMATDGTLGDPILDRQRAYMIGNAVCGESTTGNFHIGIESIDNRIRGLQVEFVGCATAVKPPIQRGGGGGGGGKRPKRR